MQPSVAVRAATHDDIAVIQRVARATWRATYAGKIPDADIEHFLDSAYSERSLIASVNRLGDGFVIAEFDGEAVGYAMAGLNRDGEPELLAIYVLPAQHGSGVGIALWNAAQVVLAGRGQSRMCCWVLESNSRARRFYERQGAIMTEEREVAIGATGIKEAHYCVAISSQPLAE